MGERCHPKKHDVKRRKLHFFTDGIFQVCRKCGEFVEKFQEQEYEIGPGKSFEEMN